MDVPEPFLSIRPYLDPSRAELIRTHYARLPRPEQGGVLLSRWAEGPGLPSDSACFLYLLYLASLSEALFLSLLRRPNLRRPLFGDVAGGDVLGRSGMEEALARWQIQHRLDPIESRLSGFRAYHTARVLLMETLGGISFDDTLDELTALADVLVARAYLEAFHPMREEHGLPLRLSPDGRSVPCSLAVLALGKLGGHELNYASDVDLVYFYERDGQTDRGMENHAFFDAWVRSATALLSRPTPDGPCFKVDPNLRPRGRDGELTLSFDSALAYYREWADLWERQAWTRARACAGDTGAGRRFLRLLEREIYRPYIFTGVASQNRKMRTLALSRLASEDPDGENRNIKEGPGGIRDIEFTVQALQMTHGQTDRWIREPNTLLAITKLGQKGYLSARNQGRMARAYVRFRRAEHWAQIHTMRQTHRLPGTEVEWSALARYLGAASGEEAHRRIEEDRRQMAALFTATLNKLAKRDREKDHVDRLLSKEGILESLRMGRFLDPERAFPLLSGVYSALEPWLDCDRRRENFLRVHFSLQKELAGARDPFVGLLAIHRLIPSLQTSEDLFGQLLDRPRLPRLLFRLAAASQPLMEMLQQWPGLIAILSYEGIRSLPDRIGGIERATDLQDLRHRKKETLFLLGARSLLVQDTHDQVRKWHTEAGSACLKRCFAMVCADTEAAESLPPGIFKHSLSVLAMGRLGMGEMHPRSDLDLLFVKHEEWVLPKDPERSALVEERLLKRIAAALTEVTREGSLYPVDLELRPDGASGPMLPRARALPAYLSERAELWERIAWLKARPIAGDTESGGQLLDRVRRTLFDRGIAPGETDRLSTLRHRLEQENPDVEGLLKFAPGGLMELDFFLLCHHLARKLPPGPGGTPGLLARLRDVGLLDIDTAARLFRARRFQDKLLYQMRLRFLRPPGKRTLSEALSQVSLKALVSDVEGADGAPDGLTPGERARWLEALWAQHREAVHLEWTRLRASFTR